MMITGPFFLSDIPAYPDHIILARLADRSITTNVMRNRWAKAWIVYGSECNVFAEAESVWRHSAGNRRSRSRSGEAEKFG
jgi:hypothetical protein